MKITIYEGAIFVTVLMFNDCFLVTSKISTGLKFCSHKSGKSCLIMCKNLNLSSSNDVDYFRQVIQIGEKENKSCTLKFEGCIHTQKSANVWDGINPTILSKIISLKLFNSYIDFNHMNLYQVKNLQKLTAKNTQTAILQQNEFRNLPHLQKIYLKHNRLLISAEKGVLKGLNIKVIQIQGINLGEADTKIFFQNLTGEWKIPSVEIIDWSFNNFGNFPQHLLKYYPNLKSLKLNDSKIYSFSNETFENENLKIINISNNKIKKLPENIFRPIFKKAWKISIAGNDLICDCQMEWIQQYVKKSKKIMKDFRNLMCVQPNNSPFLETKMCQQKPFVNTTLNEDNSLHSLPLKCQKVETADLKHLSYNQNISKKFYITKDDPDYIQISMSDNVDMKKGVLWYINFSNSTFPVPNCLKILYKEFVLQVIPDTNYLFCFLLIDSFQINIFDCLFFKSKPLHENQTWLTNKSIPLSVMLVTTLVLFALVMGGLILYLSIHKNPSLIRGSKRVIEVKRHDKTQILLMPRGYEDTNGGDENGASGLPGSHLLLEPSKSSMSCDTLSTVSYVSANQPTQLEILTYKLNRLRELFQNTNDIPPPMPLLPTQIAKKSRQRIPSNVDLLFEYEWYTITTTTTTTTEV